VTGPCKCGHPASKHDNVACFAKVGSGVATCPCKRYAPKVSSERRFPKGAAPAYLAWIRRLPCVVSNHECEGTVEAAHVKSKGAGGCDEGNTLPLCAGHHYIQHTIGIRSFAVRYEKNLELIAANLLLEYERECGVPVL
jgi:hypothetical protein